MPWRPERCERIVQAPMPDLPIEKGRPGPGLVAKVVVSKYLDGLQLYRQSAILAREGIAIERATLADWVGHATWWVTPLAALIGAHVMAAPVIHTDDTPIAVLAPGNGKTRTGRLWTYVVDERPWQGGRAPAAYYRFSPDRRGERPRDHLALFRGAIQADAFSGYAALTRPASAKYRVGRGPPLLHAACWAHARGKFYEVFESTKSPIALAAADPVQPTHQRGRGSWRHALRQYPELLFEAPASPPLRTRENLAVNLTSPRMSTPEILLIDQPRIIHCAAARKRAAASTSIRRAQDDPQLTLTREARECQYAPRSALHPCSWPATGPQGSRVGVLTDASRAPRNRWALLSSLVTPD
jgi:Transposase IS66 family